MVSRFLDTTNPLIYFGLIALALLFLFLSVFGIVMLSFLLAIAFSGPEFPHPISLIVVFAMLILGVWNLIDSAKLIGDAEPKRLVFILVRSLLAIAPVVVITLISVWV
ncbi:hypothetical protein [uncultured Parasphingorhabdus sp.]|uniref:hypothetical protein n=1 Tax=uncultured Parasphingorhabdus sp. TaxID=2709694 RepID=UPI002AA84A99|nr:hypothetical protein [uncultured Parasphingorhabdus sp.]